ncbi:SURF1 family cytochrome oxidase biogenesis protein [Sphingomonas xinjiangensis]|uniref:SURF1-like protein n=1 Tax=Sphingomonas xinjiangensis TaxID=643568 RepID=A0A840YGK3_9SPHN|nr:SURF1 family cytochrome oxidase biogenesis protein [Sphingomonas xinjiangensis]MBB5711425.1 surfeit locus 1 family protein [Sphingomonas xinjiangensis]
MRRVPIIPTLLVMLAVAAMIGLGVWQLADRRPKKLAFLEQLAANPAKPPIAFPRTTDDRLLFRRVSAMCLQPLSGRIEGAGAAGFRWIVECRTGAEGPGMTVQLGTTRDPLAKPVWKGGMVQGYLSHAPDSRPMVAALFDHTPQRLMLVADTPPPGLAANAAPDLSSVPNNHLAYGVQWFLFAAVATVIYVLALRLRNRTRPVSI